MIIISNVLIRPGILPDKAGAVREAQGPNTRGKGVLAARGRKAYFWEGPNFVHWAPNKYIKVEPIMRLVF